MRDDDVRLGIDGALDVGADHPAVSGAGCRRFDLGADVGICQGNLAIGRVGQRFVHRLQPCDLLLDAATAPGKMDHLLRPRVAFFLPVDAHHLVDVAIDIGLQVGQPAGDLALGEIAVAVVDRPELGSPSMATLSPFGVPIRRHSSTNSAQVLGMAAPLSRRKSAIDL